MKHSEKARSVEKEAARGKETKDASGSEHQSWATPPALRRVALEEQKVERLPSVRWEPVG